jgi:hypothetical protein
LNKEKKNQGVTQKGGGGEKVIPAFIDRENPGVPLEHQSIERERYGQPYQPGPPGQQYQSGPPGQPRGQPRQQEPIVDLKVYNQKKPQPDQKYSNIAHYPPMNINPFYPPQFANAMMPQSLSMLGSMYPMTVNVNKIYEINGSGPTGQHQRLMMIYEDVLPEKSLKTTFKTVGERITQIQFVRSILFHEGDGTETSLDGSTANSLISHMKFLDLNPYNTSKYSNNPYKGLPDGLLLYRTCYPIKRSEPFGHPICARNSTALNVRIYRMTTGAYLVNKQSNTKFYEYDQWREIAYYEYIREHVIKKKLCPNFVTMYGYYLCNRSGVDFDKITKINLEDKQIGPPPAEKLINPVGYLNIYDKRETDFVRNVTMGLRQINPGNVIQKLDAERQLKNLQMINKPVDLNSYCGEVLIAITESPTYNLFSWASKTYQQEGNTRKMVNTGCHSEITWRSVIFQLMVALYVMSIHNIYIKDFSLRNNVFIRDLVVDGTVTNYWKYRINGIDYYIPNCGFVLLIDTNYKDIDVIPSQSLPTKTNKDYKLDGTLFDVGNCIAGNEKDKIFAMFKEAIGRNNFDNDFTRDGGIKPEETILNTLDSMAHDTSTDINDYFINYMSKFMNNRIGTYLKEQEIVHMRHDDTKQFRKGQIIVQAESTGTYKFVLYIDTNNGKATILTKKHTAQNDPQFIDKDKEIIIKEDVNITTLSNYSLTEPIAQNFKINESNLNEDNILESYNIII